jgi:ssDNA-binding Zn-finger/Zn-ribbon topoisomerase 1
MKRMDEEIERANGAQALDDDMLDGVSGGLVQLINPSCYEPGYYFKDGTICQHCGHDMGDYENKRMICHKCNNDMVVREVARSEVKWWAKL